MFEVYATAPSEIKLADVPAFAQRAQALGYDGLKFTDGAHDALLAAALALNATSTLKVGTAVLVAFPRSPMTVAVAAWDLQAASGGRFELGLGTQVRGNIVRRYSTPWSAPVPRMRDYVGALRAIFDSFQNGTAINFQSEHYPLSLLQKQFSPGPIDHPHLPILLGAVGPLMTALAGEVADGVITHPTNSPPRVIEEITKPALYRGAHKVGRGVEQTKLSLGSSVITANDKQSLAKEREIQRANMGFIFSTPSYWTSLDLFGWREKGERLFELSKQNDWASMSQVIDDDMLNTFLPCACYGDIAEVIKERYTGVATTINFPMPIDPKDDKAVASVIAQLRG